ncbi:MAG: DUF2220 family protein [Ghiorsea sp.]|nr:DUF2220 family protein [Ghiorsea sp.]
MKTMREDDIKAKVQRCWMRGDVCRAALGHEDFFPWYISLGKPSSKQMLDDFPTVQDWVKNIQAFARKKKLDLQWHTINHRVLGTQQLPSTMTLSTPEQAARLVGQVQALRQWLTLYQLSMKQHPDLQPWLLKHPLKVLALGDVWHHILALCAWMQSHPKPSIYMRQVDVVGVDSKFIEQHKKVLSSLWDLILPDSAVDKQCLGVSGFARRYGFLDKPTMLRVRPLDEGIRLLHGDDGDQDVALTAHAFTKIHADLLVMVKRVVIVENEINYLTFPNMNNTLLIFGSGYGFEALKRAKWLHDCSLYYWGDLDTHGFSILNQLKAIFPHTQSFLMDKKTLMKHQYAWGIEPKQEKKDLTYLSPKEMEVYDDLRYNRLTNKLRLEQERITYADVLHIVRVLMK